jgi:hypothetical protein
MWGCGEVQSTAVSEPIGDHVTADTDVMKSIIQEAIDNNLPIPWHHTPSRNFLEQGLGFSNPLVAV